MTLKIFFIFITYILHTGLHSMEAKNTGVYIDAVKQIMSIYKQLDQCNRGRVT